MDDLISRQTLIEAFKEEFHAMYSDEFNYMIKWFENLPATVSSEFCDQLWKIAYEHGKRDAQPTAEPRKGKWIVQITGWGDMYYECSCCKEAFTFIDGTPTDNNYYYCPNCGARMEE